jgi:hypothetical protein
LTRRPNPDNLAAMRALPMLLTVPLLAFACNGGDQLGEPWGSPPQYSTALADTPYPPRDLAMFDGVSGRVVMWADLARLVRRTNVIVIDGKVECTQRVGAAMQSNRRVVVRCRGSVTMSEVGAAIGSRYWWTGVTTVALVPSSSRALRPEDRDLADVVAYTTPTRIVRPEDVPAATAPARPAGAKAG